MNASSKKRMNKLADKFRSGRGLSSAEDAELTDLEAEFLSGAPDPIQPRNVWELPIAKSCFDADQHE